MNIMQFTNSAQTMSSREIATLCEKRHDNVCRDIEKLNESYAAMGLLKIEEGYYTHPNTGNQQHRQFLLTHEQTLDLITGYKLEVRIRINRRWLELEARHSQPIVPQTLPEALRLAAELAEQNQQQAQQLAITAPKAAAFDAITPAEGSMSLRDAAKTLGFGQNQFIQWCLQNRWLYRDQTGRLKAYASRIDQGHIEQKLHLFVGRDGAERVAVNPTITPRGVTHLAKIFGVTV